MSVLFTIFLRESKDKIGGFGFRKALSEKECVDLARLIAANKLQTLAFEGSFECGECSVCAQKQLLQATFRGNRVYNHSTIECSA
jgi:hypothetical protein